MSKKSLQKQIMACRKRLQVLKEQRAEFGELHVPPYIILDIDKTEAEIKELEAELENVKGDGGAIHGRNRKWIAIPIILAILLIAGLGFFIQQEIQERLDNSQTRDGRYSVEYKERVDPGDETIISLIVGTKPEFASVNPIVPELKHNIKWTIGDIGLSKPVEVSDETGEIKIGKRISAVLSSSDLDILREDGTLSRVSDRIEYEIDIDSFSAVQWIWQVVVPQKRGEHHFVIRVYLGDSDKHVKQLQYVYLVEEVIISSEPSPTPSPTPTPLPTPSPVPPIPTPSPAPVRPTSTPIPLRQKDGAEMVFVPAGEFVMGDSKSEFADQTPEHIVYLDAFLIDKYEITRAQYQKCVEAGVCNKSCVETDTCGDEEAGLFDKEKYNLDNQPIVGIYWTDAQAYCNWVDARLPTEAEWEKAARGMDRRKYPWGNDFDSSKLNSLRNDGFDNTVAPVGSFPEGASPYGALDMAGNVWEWTSSLYKLNKDEDEYFGYAYDSEDGRENLKLGDNSHSTWAVRGGSWENGEEQVTTTWRNSYTRGTRYAHTGFRCVRSVEANQDEPYPSVSPPIPTNTFTPSPTLTPDIPQEEEFFPYFILVESEKNDQPIENARVTLVVEGKEPVEGFTASKGYVDLNVASSFLGNSGYLMIEADGYEKMLLNVDIEPNKLPHIIRLEPIAP